MNRHRGNEMIERIDGFPAGVIAFACKGHVTKADYDQVVIPAVEKAFQKEGKLRLYYQIDPSFSGIEAGAVWEDFQVGTEYLSRWERIAVVTDVDWIRHTIRVFSFLMPGVVRIFPVNEQRQAREWIVEGIPRAARS